jgi:NAD(P)-dependent dehydrogenase (short-subunit alcohol dehydrogenase family)
MVVITGGNRGLGYAVARHLARQSCSVVLLARDRARGEAVRSALAVAGVAGGAGVADVRLVVGDLSSRRTVGVTAGAILDACPRIDVLVHNAGVWPTRLEHNEDGIERAFATNHLAPFQLNLALEARLASSGARVVQVSAGLYVKGCVDVARTPTGADFHAIRTYATTKLCNLMLVPLFARRWEDAGVTINAVHPGVIRTGLGDPGGALGLVLKGIKLFWRSPRNGARPVARLATAPSLSGVTGRYFDIDRELPLAPVAQDTALAERLWTQALELCRLRGASDPAPFDVA